MTASDNMQDRFLRTRLLLGPQAVERLSRAHVTVVGLGAVGSYAVEGLARSGVGHLRVVDFDNVTTTNINRQLYATDSTVGRQKTDVARARIGDINPACSVEALTVFVDALTVADVLSPAPDILVDAIDSLSPKAALLAAAVERHIPVVSSMGAALRRDPSRIHVASLFATRACPLAKHLRKRLRHLGKDVDITCVYSDEPVPESESVPDCSSERESMERGRKRRTLGSMSTLTGIFGLWLATEAIRRLTVARSKHQTPQSRDTEASSC